MSQHIFKEIVGPNIYRIQLGWDKPCQMFYGVVFPWIEDAGHTQGGYWNEDEPTWSSIYESRLLNLNQIATKIEDLGITIPEKLLQNVLIDRFKNSVNKVNHYDPKKVSQGMSR